jgi:uncharacterized protein GlcG (DUF336 family)
MPISLQTPQSTSRKIRRGVRAVRVPSSPQDRQANGETFILRLTGVTPVAGAMPIVVGGKLIGAIGLSGGTSQQDHQVAQAGASAVK